MVFNLALYPILGKPFILYLGIITLISFIITAILGLTIHNRWSNIRFKWHPAMVVISLLLAIFMGIIGIEVGKPNIGIVGILSLFLFIIAMMLGFSFYKRRLKHFILHPAFVLIAFIFAIIHGTLGILIII